MSIFTTTKLYLHEKINILQIQTTSFVRQYFKTNRDITAVNMATLNSTKRTSKFQFLQIIWKTKSMTYPLLLFWKAPKMLLLFCRNGFSRAYVIRKCLQIQLDVFPEKLLFKLAH